MFRRKTTIAGAVAVMFLSSILGATVLRGPEGNALDALDTTAVTLETLEESVVDAAAPVLTGGVGESLVLVIAAQVPTADVQGRLAQVNETFDELQGFSLDASDNYELTGLYAPEGPDTLEVSCTEEMGCPEGVATVHELQPVELRYVPLAAGVPLPTGAFQLVPGQTLLVSGFRTKEGAERFIELSRAMGLSDLSTVQARKLGGGDIGLGQEANPDGSGPLLEPLDDQQAFQR